jgi:predicted N-acyltransferase
MASDATGSAVSVSLIGGAAAVEPRAWNRLATRGHHLHRWFMAAEAGAVQPRHLGVGDGRGLRAIVPAYLERGGLHGDLHDRWFGPASKALAALGLRLRPTLAVVLPFGTASEPLGDLAALPDAAIDAVFHALEQQACADGARAVVWPFVAEDQQHVLRIAARRGYARAFAGLTARLEVEWHSFDEYLTSRSRNVRRTIRREIRALSEAGIEMRATHDFRSIAPAIDSLYRDGYQRRNGRLPVLDREFFPRLAELADDSLWVQAAWQGGVLVGASVNMVAGGRVDGGLAAFGPGGAQSALFAADLVYEPLRIAFARDYGALELGPTALQAKTLRGATMKARFALVRGMGRGVRAAVVPLAAATDAWTRHKERKALDSSRTREGS